MKVFIVCLLGMLAFESFGQSLDLQSLRSLKRSLRNAQRSNRENNPSGVDQNLQEALRLIAPYVRGTSSSVSVNVKNSGTKFDCNGQSIQNAAFGPQSYVKQDLMNRLQRECDRRYLECDMSTIQVQGEFFQGSNSGPLATGLGQCSLSATVTAE